MQFISDATRRRSRTTFFVALAASLVVHLSAVLWPLRVPGVAQNEPSSLVVADLHLPPQPEVSSPQAEARVEPSPRPQTSDAQPQTQREREAGVSPREPQPAATMPDAPPAGALAKPAPTPQSAVAPAPTEGFSAAEEQPPNSPTAIDKEDAAKTTPVEAPPSSIRQHGAPATGAEAQSTNESNNKTTASNTGTAPAPSAVETWTAFMPADNTAAAPTRFNAQPTIEPLDSTATASSLDAPSEPSAESASETVPRPGPQAAHFIPETLAQLQSEVAVNAAPAASPSTPRPFTGFIVHLRPASSLPDPFADASLKELPLRVDLGYKVFLGSNGLLIGDGTYTFEHSGDTYHIVSFAQPRGLAATLVPGRGRAESRGVITSRGLQPQEFSIERGSPDKREIANFDWSTGTVALYGDKQERFDVQTSDPMALLWQFYFAPPAANEFTFSVATTRRIYRYTIKRERREKIAWGNRLVDTEVWRRRSNDGSADVYAWLAPSLNYAPVKLRVAVAPLGVVEALLDTMQVHDAPAR